MARGQHLCTTAQTASFTMGPGCICQLHGPGVALTGQAAASAPLPSAMARQDVASGALVPLPEWQFAPTAVSIVTASRRLMPSKIRAFIDHLSSEQVPPFDGWSRRCCDAIHGWSVGLKGPLRPVPDKCAQITPSSRAQGRLRPDLLAGDDVVRLLR